MKPEVQKHIEYASGYLDLKMYGDAGREADKALALAPNLPQAIAIKSAVLWQANRLREAEPFVARLAELNPRDSGMWINLALSAGASSRSMQRWTRSSARSMPIHR